MCVCVQVCKYVGTQCVCTQVCLHVNAHLSGIQMVALPIVP